ncbi:hypothetical protein L9F63_015989 [Diploptera punctata]|uniref:Transcription initiation factor TFIID subunit 6 n=1 Tax=Diploptera punctata TaxID=6984 RepID=A0AAD8EHY7_DIPPU|nr:hypothetical protein L9F63_015989 [Diploptera punctata]
MSGKSDQLQSHKKKTEKKSGEGRKYGQISYDSVVAAAESNGITGLQEDVAKQLAEDVSYRLREIIHKCSVHMRQNKRRKLTTADVNAVFQISDVPTIYGHVGAEEQINYVYIKEANIFVPAEVEIELPAMALSNTVYIQKRAPFVKGDWINADTSSEAGVKSEDSKPVYQPPSHLITYYKHISKIIMGSSEKHLQVVLKDLQCNNKIGPVIMYLINMLTLGLSKLSRGGPGTFLRHRFLRTIEALTVNTYIKPNTNISVHHLISMVLKCVLDPALIEGISPKCNYQLRDTAAHVLAKVVNSWCSSESKLQLEILQKLGSVLLDGSSSLRSHYAALRTLCALGHEALDYCLWPHLEQYLLFLDTLYVQRSIKTSKGPFSPLMRFQQHSDLIEIEGAILDAAEMMYRKICENQSTIPQNTMILERMLETHFGDALCARRSYYTVTEPKCEGNNPVSNGSAMEVDTLVPSVMKDTSSNDFELDYRNWTAIAKIPIHVPPLFLSNNKNLSSLPDRRMNAHTSSRVSSAFEISIKNEYYSSTIHFSFAGANPMSKRRLKRRRLDPSHAQLACPSIYFAKSCQVSCIGKLNRKQHKSVLSRSWSVDIKAVL